MTTNDEGGRSGPPSYYRPKSHRPVTLTLTDAGHAILADTSDRSGASRADVVEQLLRRFAVFVTFPDEGPRITMTVTIDPDSKAPRTITGISAIGIGHTNKHLVLVPGDGKPPETIGPDQWTTLRVVREDEQ